MKIAAVATAFPEHYYARHDRPPGGAWGLLAAMEPGFCSQLVPLRW